MKHRISRADYVKACTAFWEALEENPAELYFPVHLGEHQIVVSRTPDAGVVRAQNVGLDDDPAAVLSIVTTIEVVDQ